LSLVLHVSDGSIASPVNIIGDVGGVEDNEVLGLVDGFLVSENLLVLS